MSTQLNFLECVLYCYVELGRVFRLIHFRLDLINHDIKTVTFDQNGQNAIYADFEFLAVSLPD